MRYGVLTRRTEFTGPDMKPRIYEAGTIVKLVAYEKHGSKWRLARVVGEYLFERYDLATNRVRVLSPLEMLASVAE